MFDLAVTLGLMFFGAYGAGYVPYAFDIHESQISTLASLGGGLMVGSSLAVIVPEGFHAFQGHNEHEDDVGSVDVDDHNHSDEMPDGYAGMALVTGFLAMLILDQVQQQHQGSSKDSHGCCGPGHKKAMEGEGTVDAVDVSSGDVVGDPERAITGLLIHCCADGLAMGSAFMSGNASLSLVLGAAMVLHKAPMAFGLSSYLMSCRWTWARAQKTLLVFSATAPVATIMTFGLLNILPFMSGEKSVALAILFSGGTFLYASTMHILPEVSSKGKMGKNETLAIAAGCLLPVLLSWGHHH